MAEPDLIEEEAVRYLLGELGADERRQFEARLERSAELRALVRELEEGAVTLAAAAPPRRLPSDLWPQIESAVERERRGASRLLGWWVGWVRSGWAVATVCVVGWVLYALLVKPPGPAIKSPEMAVQAPATSPLRASNALATRPDINAPPNNNTEFALLLARTQELAALNRKVADLETRLTQVSRTASQQQLLLSESNRLKFFQLSFGTGDANEPGAAPPISPRLQWALYTAMARELGWRTAPGTATATTAESAHGEDAKATSASGVDFVDLRPSSNTVASPATGSKESTQVASTTASSVSSNGVAGFIAGTSAYLAFDSLLVPNGSALTFWITGDTGQYQALGNTTYGNNPLVVTVPTSAGTTGGSVFTVTATTPSGVVTNIGHVFLPVMPPP